MAVYVSETTDDERGDHLRIVRAGNEQRLPFMDGETDVVRVPAAAPAWVDRILREHGYSPQRPENLPVVADSDLPATAESTPQDTGERLRAVDRGQAGGVVTAMLAESACTDMNAAIRGRPSND